MNQTARHAYSEFLGTFALVIGAGGSTMIAYSFGGGVMEIAVATGLIVMVFTAAFARFGAQFNPAITIGLLFTRRIAPSMAAWHIAAQLAGAITAAFILKALYPESVVTATRVGGTVISVSIPAMQAWGMEVLAGFIVMSAYYSALIDKRVPPLAGLPVGLAVAVNIVIMAPLSGGSMNPARSIGPMMAAGIYEGLIIFVTAPVVGALLAALAYEFILLDRESDATG